MQGVNRIPPQSPHLEPRYRLLTEEVKGWRNVLMDAHRRAVVLWAPEQQDKEPHGVWRAYVKRGPVTR
jgi:hypothetical protein